MLKYARSRRWCHLCVVNLRILIGFAFVPSGLKKVLDQPFTDPNNTGVFHEFLHAFYATGFFYRFVGATQLVIAVLLMTQGFATIGALMALPVFVAITVLCWSTQVYPTAVVASLILLGVVGLVAWDFRKWRGVLATRATAVAVPACDEPESLIDLTLWARCGAAILALYVVACAVDGGIYRPKTVELDNPAFYVFPLIALFPIVTYLVEWRQRRSR